MTPEQSELQRVARDFARRELAAEARRIEETSEPPGPEVLKRLGEMGFLGINIDSAYGGHGLTDLDALLVLEEFVKLHPALAFPVFESVVGPIKAIERFAPEALKKRLIPDVCAGRLTVAIAMSEPDAGTALTDLKTRGATDGDSVVLNGRKRWSSGGGHAGGYLVYCRLSDAPGAKGSGAV
ncbi:MAG: acyl-CoA dehydrogenase family protein [Parvibaculaceae bacterium]